MSGSDRLTPSTVGSRGRSFKKELPMDQYGCPRVVKVRGNRGTIKPRLEAVIKALDMLRHDLPFGDHKVVGNMEGQRDKTTSVTD